MTLARYLNFFLCSSFFEENLNICTLSRDHRRTGTKCTSFCGFYGWRFGVGSGEAQSLWLLDKVLGALLNLLAVLLERVVVAVFERKETRVRGAERLEGEALDLVLAVVVLERDAVARVLVAELLRLVRNLLDVQVGALLVDRLPLGSLGVLDLVVVVRKVKLVAAASKVDVVRKLAILEKLKRATNRRY